MIVGELIEALKAFPATARVAVENDLGSGDTDATGVRNHSYRDKVVPITFNDDSDSYADYERN